MLHSVNQVWFVLAVDWFAMDYAAIYAALWGTTDDPTDDPRTKVRWQLARIILQTPTTGSLAQGLLSPPIRPVRQQSSVVLVKDTSTVRGRLAG
jgi:hypothetical protein